MNKRKGILNCYKNENGRYEVLLLDSTSIYELHCGDGLELLINGKWIEARVEYDKDFYLITKTGNCEFPLKRVEVKI